MKAVLIIQLKPKTEKCLIGTAPSPALSSKLVRRAWGKQRHRRTLKRCFCLIKTLL